ncbi:MAG: GNAT family N-acetyltransferase [Chloroflexi bacterium]|nr:GNAT family N-acetyltransferase [Chloroflexota bacterium]
MSEAEAGGVKLSALDTERFGVPSARVDDVSAETLPAVLAFCRAHGVTFLIARCPTSDLKAAQAMEQAGFLLMDTLIYYARDLHRSPIPPDSGQVPVRPLLPGDEEQVRQVAREAFSGYSGHYHADERLDRAQCDAVYTSWAERSAVSREVAGEVLIADLDGQVAGFATLRMNSPDEGEGVLFGVAPFAQGRGIYRSFMVRGMEWSLGQGARRMVVSTQITNLAVQKVWTRVGFEPSGSYYTFHKWFDAPGAAVHG